MIEKKDREEDLEWRVCERERQRERVPGRVCHGRDDKEEERERYEGGNGIQSNQVNFFRFSPKQILKENGAVF